MNTFVIAILILAAIFVGGWLFAYIRYLVSGEYEIDKRIWNVTRR